jgi:hypothetical protein
MEMRFKVLTAASMKIIIALMMMAVSTSETSVNFYETTRRNNPQDGNLHGHGGNGVQLCILSQTVIRAG